jgi:hypothetical protein
MDRLPYEPFISEVIPFCRASQQRNRLLTSQDGHAHVVTGSTTRRVPAITAQKRRAIVCSHRLSPV